MPLKHYKFTHEKRDRFLQLLREGMRRGAAAAAVGAHDDMVNVVSFAAEELVRRALVPPLPRSEGRLVLNYPTVEELRAETPLQRALRWEREAEKFDWRPRRRWWG